MKCRIGRGSPVVSPGGFGHCEDRGAVGDEPQHGDAAHRSSGESKRMSPGAWPRSASTCLFCLSTNYVAARREDPNAVWYKLALVRTVDGGRGGCSPTLSMRSHRR